MKQIRINQIRDDFSDKTLRLQIIETSNLKADNYVVHPFVKIHMVHMKNGSYLQKGDFEIISAGKKNAVYQKEYRTHCIRESGPTEKKMPDVIFALLRVIVLSLCHLLLQTHVTLEFSASQEQNGTIQYY